ncbi:hypothetical protein BOTBODRAFT_180138 [Botryobasidium botryosum FD-172 SS1]|uniref:Cytochrome P450 n=1 Tax=Botryobasidium botryosum (strain FD-172 SS1) TaxID=930990 RepID=A0A067M942_BOTB1|nr:hypothetical protein BOTBODRAFT_180138 [Botryobasidium botryosum FD-172 SS1]
MGLTKKWFLVRQACHCELGVDLYGRDYYSNPKSLDEKDHNSANLFDNLLAGSEAEASSGRAVLTQKEVIAGREARTAAHSLAFSLGLLACYPEEQQKLYDHIKSVSYEDMHSLTRSLAVLYETMRLFPPVPDPFRAAARDTTLSTYPAFQEHVKGETSTQNERRTIFIPKGSTVSMDVPGFNYNPRYWDEPYEFKPDRFMGKYDKDTFIAFSLGPRACLGRRFSEVEAVAALSLITLRYQIKLDPARFTIIPDESHLAMRARLLKIRQGLTLAPASLPLLFRKRVWQWANGDREGPFYCTLVSSNA